VRRSRVATILVIVALCAASAPARADAAPSSTGGNVDPALDAVAPDTVAVVASGAPVEGAVPVIVRNGTAHHVTVLRIRATAVDGSGRKVARGVTNTIVPRSLEPGGLALARVEFHDTTMPASTTYKFDATSTRARDARTAALEPTAFDLSPPTTGPVAQTLDVTLRNPTTSDVHGPVLIAVMCFGEARRPTVLVATKSRIDRTAPAASVRVSVELRDVCPAYLVAANAIRDS
jgi:hypothetical protein